MPPAECRLSDPDKNLSCNQCTSSLYLSQGRLFGIAKQKRYLACHVTLFTNPQERKGIRDVGPAVRRKQSSVFLLNSKDLNRSMIKAGIMSHVFLFFWSFPFDALSYVTEDLLSNHCLISRNGFLTCFL